MHACWVSWGSEMLFTSALVAARGGTRTPEPWWGLRSEVCGGSLPAVWWGGCPCLCHRLSPCLDQLAAVKIKEKTKLNLLWQGMSLDP